MVCRTSDVFTKIETQQYRPSISAENIHRKLTGRQLENGGAIARGVDLLGEMVRLPGRFLTAEDEFFKAVGYRMELHARAFRKASDEGLRRVSILCGNGGLYLPQELARGADGAMTGFAYPEMLVAVVALYRAGEHDQAEDVFDAFLPLVRHEQQPGFGLALRKEVLYRRGVISSPKVRAPGPSLNDTDHQELTRLIERVERNREAL